MAQGDIITAANVTEKIGLRMGPSGDVSEKMWRTRIKGRGGG